MIIYRLAIYSTLALTYLGLALGYIPGLRMNRATIALVGSTWLIALGVLTLQEAWQAIDVNTIIFILSMMVVNAHLTYSGFFRRAMSLLLSYTRSPLGLLTSITFGSGVLSAIFLNDTIALILTPLVLKLTQSLSRNPIPYLLAIAGATNIGSASMLSGNPQNILIGSFSQIPYLEFLRLMAPVALIGLLIQVAWLWLLYPEVRSLEPLDKLDLIINNSTNNYIDQPLWTKSGLITGGLLIAFLIGLPLAQSALVAASLLLITRQIKPQHIFQQIDGSLLVMFSGLFILTEATQKLHLLDKLIQMTNSPISFFSVTVVLSNLISNVPAVLLLHQSISHDNVKSWLLLSAGSTLAGNLTLLGSVANLIVAEAAISLSYRLGFWEHLRFGFPLTILTLFLAYLWIN